jgi:hypothetical protein
MMVKSPKRSTIEAEAEKTWRGYIHAGGGDPERGGGPRPAKGRGDEQSQPDQITEGKELAEDAMGGIVIPHAPPQVGHDGLREGQGDGQTARMALEGGGHGDGHAGDGKHLQEGEQTRADAVASVQIVILAAIGPGPENQGEEEEAKPGHRPGWMMR